MVDEDYSEIDLLTGFCQSFAKWQRQSKNVQYSEIEENQDFSVSISVLTPGNTVKASVCCCTRGNTEQLGFKAGKVLLLNWYHHIQHFCRKKSGSKSLDSFYTITTSKKSVDLASQMASVTTVNMISPTITDEYKLCNQSCTILNQCYARNTTKNNHFNTGIHIITT